MATPCTLTLTSTGYKSQIIDPDCTIGATKTGHYSVNGVNAWSIQQVVNGSFVKTVGTVTGGVTTDVGTNFVVFNRDQYITDFTANLIGPNDGNDWCFVDNEVKKAGATPTSVAKFTNFTVNLGDETAGLGTDDDIFYMGSAKVKSSSTSAAPTAGTPVVTQGNVTEIGVNYIADNVQVNTGRGNDSVVYGGAIIDATTKLTATEIKNTKSNLGTGSDSVAFNQVQAIGAGNVVDLGFDTDVDTINFVNYSGSSNTGDNKFGATSLVTINNFGVNDVLVLGGVTKTGKADAQAYINSQGLSSNIVIT